MYSKMRSAIQTKALICLGLSFFISAFRDADDEIARYIHQVKARPSKPVESLPLFEKLKRSEFSEKNERQNPFNVDRIKTLLNLQVNHFNNSTSQFSLSTLHFVGTVKQETITWALIHQPNGLVTHVSIGDYLGELDYQVIDIQEEELQLQQKLRVGGNWEVKTIKLPLFISDAS